MSSSISEATAAPGSLALHRRLGVQLGLAVAVVVGVSFLTTGWIAVERQRETLTRQFTLRLLSETRSLALAASGPLLHRDPEFELRPFVVKALSQVPDLVDLVVLDTQNKVLGHRDLLQVGRDLTQRPMGTRVVLPGIAAGDAWLEGNEIVIEQPILRLDERIGTLVARASRAGIEASLHRAQSHLMWLGGAGTLVAIAAVLLLVRLNLRPLDELRRGVLRLASGDLATRVRVRRRNELGLFADLVNSMAAGLQAAQTNLIQKERLDRELEIARDLQSMLLPQAAAPPTGYQLQAHYVPALEVSGDYYDVLPLDADRVALVTADVSGKGVPGLVVMSMLRTALHMLAPVDGDVEGALVQASRMLRKSLRPGMFVTCLYGVLNTRQNTFHYVSAGHCPPILFGAKEPRLLEAGGKPIGLFPDAIFERSLRAHTVQLEPGAGLVLYSDGLVEAMDTAGGTLGFEAVLGRLRALPAAPPSAVVGSLLDAVDRHRGARAHSDDLTLIVLRRDGQGAAAGTGRATDTVSAVDNGRTGA